MKKASLRIPPKRLLAAVDLSEISLSAWRQAVMLAKAFGAKLEVAFVNEQKPVVMVGDERVELTAALKRLVARDLHRRLGGKAPVHLLDGDPVDALTRLARRAPGDWLVMGTHGRTGFRRLLLGSVAEAMVLRAPIPVLTLRDEPRKIRSILVPVTAGPRSARGFRFAAELAVMLKARLTPIHVAQPLESDADASRLAASLVDALPPRLRAGCSAPIVSRGKVEAEVVKAAARRDLVVLQAERELVFSELLLGSTTARILRFSPTPVLVLPAAS